MPPRRGRESLRHRRTQLSKRFAARLVCLHNFVFHSAARLTQPQDCARHYHLPCPAIASAAENSLARTCLDCVSDRTHEGKGGRCFTSASLVPAFVVRGLSLCGRLICVCCPTCLLAVDCFQTDSRTRALTLVSRVSSCARMPVHFLELAPQSYDSTRGTQEVYVAVFSSAERCCLLCV
jgi:hypothetical protein